MIGLTSFVLISLLVFSSKGDNSWTTANGPTISKLSTGLGSCTSGNGQCNYNALISINISGDITHCGGALIAPNYVLTAARCIPPRDSDTIILVPGATTTNTSGYENYTVDQSDVSYPPLCNDAMIPGFEPVIALIKLSNIIPLPNARTIRLPRASQRSPASFNRLNADVCGFNSIDLQKGSRQVADHSQCRSSFLKCGIRLDDSHICATPPIPCASDGSPLAARESDGIATLVGIHLWTPGLAHNEQPELYAYVGNYLNWIYNATGIPPRR